MSIDGQYGMINMTGNFIIDFLLEKNAEGVDPNCVPPMVHV